MHAPATAWALWERWAALQEERAAIAAEIERRRGMVPAPAVRWGRHAVTSADALEAAPAPGWARLDPVAMERHHATVAGLRRTLEAAQRRAQDERRALDLDELEASARRLEEEARQLVSAIDRAPIRSPADVLARLDVIAAMWGPDGTIQEPGAPLAAVLALMEALTRCAPDFRPTWTQRPSSSS